MAEIKKINGNTLCDEVARTAADAAQETAEEAKATAAVQADMNCNDPDDPAYVKNRIGGYKRSEEERKVVYDETTAEYIDVDVMGSGTVLRYRKASDTLVDKTDWFGAKIGYYYNGYLYTFGVRTSDEVDYSVELYTEKYADGNVSFVLDGDWIEVIIAPQDTYIANSGAEEMSMNETTETTIIPKGVWVSDYPWYKENIMDNDSGGPQSLALARAARSSSSDGDSSGDFRHESITLAEYKYIGGDKIGVVAYDYDTDEEAVAMSVQDALDTHYVLLEYVRDTANTAQSTANTAQSTANTAQSTADNALFDASSEYIGNKVAGESYYIIPQQPIDTTTKTDVSGGYRYTLKTNGAFVGGTDGTYTYRFNNALSSIDTYVMPIENIQLGEDADVIEKNALALVNTVTTNGNKYVAYMTSEYIYVQEGYPMRYIDYVFVKYSKVTQKKLSSTLLPDTVAMKTDIPTYTAGDGISIEDGVIAVDESVVKAEDMSTEEWTFTLDNESTVTKKVVLM